jgi:hypothetical protein
MHIRAIAPALSCQLRHDGSPRILQEKRDQHSWKANSERYKSTAVAAASKSQYGREAPPPAKTSKTKLPMKTTASPAKTASLVPSEKSTDHGAGPPATQARRTQVPMVRAKEQLNPPSSTYAPELNVPARKADQGFISYIWKAGRSYLSFYKTGVSNVRATSKLARSLRDKAAKAAPKASHEVLTRVEWQVVQRSRKDMIRLPAFGLIFLVFGEWTPLLVMYITPIIPEPCRIPTQVKRDLAKMEEIRHKRQNMTARQAMSLMAKDRRPAGAPGSVPVNTDISNRRVLPEAEVVRVTNPLDLTHLELLLLSNRYNCHSRIWDWLLLTPPKFWLQRNVRKKFEYLRTDDELIERDGGYQAMDKREVERACIERGIDVLVKKEEDIRMALAKWYKGALPGR